MNQPFASHDLVHARPNLALEPLIHRYYAWLNLVSPAPAAMNFAKLHVPLLRSFLDAPALHRRSARDPKLRGGMFVDLEDDQLDGVSDLATRLADGPMPELSAAMDELTVNLEKLADGFDLTPRYGEIPPALRGYVELVYDLNDHARIRLAERMLYRSRHFDETAHSVDLSLATGDERPFAMTTPRFPGNGHVQATMPLRDPRIDLLFSTMTTARPFGELREAFDVSDADLATFSGLFSAEPGGSPDRNLDGPGLRVRYFGHACVVVQSGPVTVMTDPFLSDALGDGDRYAYADLPDVIDYVLITHGHQDHLELASLLKLRHRIGTVVVPKTAAGALQDPSLRLCLEALGFPNVVDVEPGETIELPDGQIVVCPFVGEHCDLDIAAKVTYSVRTGGKNLYFGADNRCVDPALFGHIHDMIGDVDMAFLGMECDGAPLSWMYGPLFSRRIDQKMSRSRKLNGSDAVEAMGIVRRLRARQAYVYAMGREPWLVFVMATNYTDDSYQLKQMAEFFQRCADVGVPARELYGRADLV
ncbi:MBL fold metallo-hydrolase [Micromonospora sp. NPDC049051]|uniref:MBL fold metallo-hydrolase n=1 Tax=Micromonospora sp. NPDC049051 TaxID=3364264 RepID=UPI00371C1401